MVESVNQKKDSQAELKGGVDKDLGRDILERAELAELRQTRTALLNILEDTEEARRRAEAEKNKTQAIITNFTDGLLVFDEDNRLSLVNPKTEEFFNVKQEELAGKTPKELGIFENLKPAMDLLQKHSEKISRKEILISKNFVLELSTTPVVREGEKTGNLVVLHDITREKRIEEMKTEFVSIAAHQLRTPLSAIKWTLRMLLDGDMGKLTKEQAEFIKKTYQSNERMISLINDLLNITRIEEGRYINRVALTNFPKLVKEVIDSFKDEIKRRKIDFVFKQPRTKFPGVMLDVEKMRLVIQNLIDNAVRYTPPGGKIKIALEYDKDKVDFSITDTGVGIPKDQHERVFTKFFRGANVVRMETEGTGLGLFTVRNIIEAHGGTVWFKSTENKETIFYFMLPLKK